MNFFFSFMNKQKTYLKTFKLLFPFLWPNKMELIKLSTDMIEFLYEKAFRDLGSGFDIN